MYLVEVVGVSVNVLLVMPQGPCGERVHQCEMFAILKYVSTDRCYTSPILKLTDVSGDQEYISEWSIFKVLDTIRPTTTGPDQIPAWFLRIGAAVFCKPLTQLFNQSISASLVPLQWKQAIISPIAKIPTPVPMTAPTSDQSRSPLSSHGSWKVIIQLFHTITELLTDHPYVVVISLDFSKAFIRSVTQLFFRSWQG